MKGFVRAFFALALMGGVGASESSAQQGPEYKDPGTATFASVMGAGCGQIYTGEIGRGLLLLGAGIAGPITGLALTASSCELGSGCSNTALWAGLGVGLVAWGFGIFDAGPSARRMNQRQGLSVQPAFGSDGGIGIGLLLSLP